MVISRMSSREEPRVFQKEDLLKPCQKSLVCIKTCAGFGDERGFQDILFIIIAEQYAELRVPCVPRNSPEEW